MNIDANPVDSILQAEWHDAGFWFRVFGYGVRMIDHRVQKPLFSEREGFKRALHIGSYCFMFLRPKDYGITAIDDGLYSSQTFTTACNSAVHASDVMLMEDLVDFWKRFSVRRLRENGDLRIVVDQPPGECRRQLMAAVEIGIFPQEYVFSQFMQPGIIIEEVGRDRWYVNKEFFQGFGFPLGSWEEPAK